LGLMGGMSGEGALSLKGRVGKEHIDLGGVGHTLYVE